MSKPQQLLQRLDDIGVSLASTGKALALIGLGSVGVELARLDEYSDLDFFVVVKDGHKAEVIANLDWLSRARPISFAFKNTPDGYKVLFDDDVYAEFAVFELHELKNAVYTEGRLVWKDDAFDEQWRIPKKQPVPWKPESREWLIGEIVTCLYVGLCRLRRGEQLSAWRFVQGHAFTLLLELTELERSDPTLDVFSKERRFEQRHPDWPAHLSRFLQGYDRVAESAQEMLAYLDQHYIVDPNIKRVIVALCGKAGSDQQDEIVMPTTPDAFDNHLEQWIAEQEKPWGVLRYKQTQANLAKHLGAGRLHILDAGGGNGMDSIPLAQQGHFVEIVDYSERMLGDALRHATQANLQDRAVVHQANVQDVGRLFPAAHFDVVLCHNVLQYVEDVPALLRDLALLLKSGGLLSLISINRYSQSYHAAFVRGDLAEALSQVDGRQQRAHIFDTVMTNYSVEEISAMLVAIGCSIEQDYGLRCMYDYWGDNERKFDPAIAEQLERLEFALMDRHPYKLLARYYHIIARKRSA